MSEPSVNHRKFAIWQKLLAEAIGTFMVTLAAMTVDILYYLGPDSNGHAIDYVSRWLARGFITAVVIYGFSDISGAHIDPAITFGFALRRIFAWPLLLRYWAAQFVGSFIAVGVLWPLFKTSIALGASHPGPAFSPITAAGCEVVLTFIIMLTILMLAQEEASVGKQSALAVGLAVAACGFFAGPISGASMNPARSIVPLVMSGQSHLIWVYAVGPFLGALLAVGVHAALCGRPNKEAQKAARGK